MFETYTTRYLNYFYISLVYSHNNIFVLRKVYLWVIIITRLKYNNITFMYIFKMLWDKGKTNFQRYKIIIIC